MLNNISIKAKLIALSIIPIVALIFMLFMELTELKNTKEGVDRIYNDRVVPLEDLKVIADDYAVFVIDAINKANAGLITVEEAAQGIKHSESQIKNMWKKYKSTELTDAEEKLAAEAEVLFQKANAALTNVHMELSKYKGNARGELDSIDGPLYADIDPISEKITELVNLQLHVAKAERDLIVSNYESSFTLLVGLALLITLALIVQGIIVYKSLIGPLNKFSSAIEVVVKESDLSKNLEIAGNNELTEIADMFNKMMAQMRDLITQISACANKLSASASELTAVSDNANTSINTQREEIEQVATAMNQMATTSQEIFKNAEAADLGARETSVQAQQGNVVVGQAIEATNALVADVDNISQRMKTLESDSESIGSIVDVIKGIAEQTNLLALNAAIEAARAGDQGRGFAVVADEVRTLAQRTQTSTQEIQQAIEELQQGTRNAVSAMDAGKQKAEGAGTKAVETGDALQIISSSVEEITSMNTLIAEASEEQTNVSEEINKSLGTLLEVSNNSTQGAQKIAQSSEHLFSLSDELQSVISEYKV
ncbi:MAG: hypothetical protein OFPI_24790 [Osedax symbiont Rs2]|nr:MAG: hypothetical protein OFPI_24790 [Osedax symbiont Rs2]